MQVTCKLQVYVSRVSRTDDLPQVQSTRCTAKLIIWNNVTKFPRNVSHKLQYWITSLNTPNKTFITWTVRINLCMT